MCQSLLPIIVSYNALISTCEKGDASCRTVDLGVDMVTYRGFSSACEQGQKLRRAFDVCAEMLRQLWSPTWSPTVL